MSAAELEQRLIDLERQIEQHRTGIWLAQHERLLRRILNKDTPPNE